VIQKTVKSRSGGQLEQRLLVLVTLGLVAFGLVMVFSATSASAALGAGDPMTFLVKQSAYAVAGLLLLTLASKFDYHRLRAIAPLLLVGAFVLCIAVIAVAPPINGARRWFLVGPISVQPSELAKLAVCVWACALLARRPTPRTVGELMKPLGIVVGLFSVLILLQPDLGTTITLSVMVAGILLVSEVPLRLLALVGSVALALGAVAIYAAPYRRERFLSFLDPWQDPQGAGFQTVQAIIGMGSGGITGEGLGHGVSKVFYLPEAHTDMIFAIVGEELGLIGSTAVIVAFGVFAWAGFRVALQCRDPFGKRLAAGLTTLICGQAAINLCAVLGIAPLTGIPLPFVSYGGSSLIVLLAAVGVLLNIAVNDRVVEARSRDRSGRDRRSHQARARSRGSAARARSDRDVRRESRPRRVAAGS
jgi:cell division protein FtsW